MKQLNWWKSIASFLVVLFTMPLGHALMMIMDKTMTPEAVHYSAFFMIAVIRCIVVALERNMSCPWLIEKMQILIWYKHLHCSLIENLTISLYGYRIRYLIESDCEGEDYDGNNYSPQADEARRNFAYHVPHLLTSQLDII